MGLSPIRVRPELRRRPWGGTRLASRWASGAATLEAPAPGSAAEPFGEAWLAGPASRSWAGPTLADLTALHGAALIGAVPYGRYGGRFPLLVKLLDAATPLSLQVHPDDAYALRHEAASGHLGKAEAWWILEAEEGAVVWWGFRAPVDRDTVRAAAAQGRVAELLRRMTVGRGDVVVNPAGTVHALGAGLVAYEVQQASDLTYRLDDHGRLGPDGRPRPLHVEQALAVARFEPGEAPASPPRATGPGRTELARTEAFVLERVVADGHASWNVGAGSLELLTHVEGVGSGHLSWSGGEADVAPADTWLLPAGLGDVRLAGGGAYARVFVPGTDGGPQPR